MLLRLVVFPLLNLSVSVGLLLHLLGLAVDQLGDRDGLQAPFPFEDPGVMSLPHLLPSFMFA